MSRETITAELVRIVAAEGTEGLSVRRLATSADVSIGTVQHYFPTKSSMLAAAMEHVSAGTEAVVDAVAGIDDPVARLHAFIDLLVPGSPDETLARVWLAFAARAAVDVEIGERYGRMWGSLRRQIAERIVDVRSASDDQASADDAASELLALVDGLAVSVMAERLDAVSAKRVAHRRLDELLG